MKVYRIARWFVLAALLVVCVLALKSPSGLSKAAPTPQAQQEVQRKITELDTAGTEGESGTVVHVSAPEIAAAFADSSAQPAQSSVEPSVPTAKVVAVSFEGDEVKGTFLTQLYGKDVYITVAGRLGSENGYVTFDPTAFKVGDLVVPVALVKPSLEKKLAEPDTREKLKLPDFVASLKIENGELVVTRK